MQNNQVVSLKSDSKRSYIIILVSIIFLVGGVWTLLVGVRQLGLMWYPGFSPLSFVGLFYILKIILDIGLIASAFSLFFVKKWGVSISTCLVIATKILALSPYIFFSYLGSRGFYLDDITLIIYIILWLSWDVLAIYKNSRVK